MQGMLWSRWQGVLRVAEHCYWNGIGQRELGSARLVRREDLRLVMRDGDCFIEATSWFTPPSDPTQYARTDAKETRMGTTDGWTAKDQARLDELQARRDAWLGRVQPPLVNLAGDMASATLDLGTEPSTVHNVSVRLAGYLRDHADFVRDVLGPFDSVAREGDAP